MTRYYIDTEFDETADHLTLISLGIACEDGRGLLLVSNEFDPASCNDWVKANVLPQLPPRETWIPKAEMAAAIKSFINSDHIELWGYFVAYDFVLFCGLFGTMLDLPTHYPKHCMDLKQYALLLNIQASLKKLVPMPVGEHDALADAHWNAKAHRYLMTRDDAVEQVAPHAWSVATGGTIRCATCGSDWSSHHGHCEGQP